MRSDLAGASRITPSVIDVSVDELVELCGQDSELYCTTFFPQTVRHPFAPFHTDAWQKLESNAPLVNLLMFRGSGKTSHCRLYTSKSIAYAISRTILYIGKSEAHAIRSTGWIKKQVENNSRWTSVYNIRQGSRWQDVEFEIMVGDVPVWVLAAGIEGSIRGINRDDWRPDLIVLDDVLDDENAHTPERRQKIENLVYGALKQSLAPATDAPHAKMISLNTPQSKEDYAVKAIRDPGWVSAVYGCFSKKTAGLPADFQESAWEERLPTETLQQEKRLAAHRNLLSTWLREMECKLVSPETASFKLPWLRKYAAPPEQMTCVYAIDPVPPPTQTQIQKHLHRNDFEAHVVWGALGNKRFLVDYALMRGHEPTWTIMKFFEFQRKYQPIVTLVEAVAYQRTLVWLMKKAMDQAQSWYAITEYLSQQSKYVRIINAHNRPASSGRLYVREDQTDFIEQFAQYPDVSHDDLLDASAIALSHLEGLLFDADGGSQHVGESLEGKYQPVLIGGCP